MEDGELLRLLKTDKNAGMRQLIEQYSGLVFALVRARLERCCDSSEIEDCVTDVFLNFQSGLKTFVPKASIKNYLAVIAKNTAGMCLRNRLQTSSLDDGDFMIELADEHDFTDEVAERQLLEKIHAELSLMGYPDRDIVIRKYYFGQSSKQIAADLKLTVSNVDTRAHRAIEKLRTKFTGDE